MNAGSMGLPPDRASQDERFMRLAIALGWRHLSLTWPNPSVGAVLVDESGDTPVIIAQGVTQAGGRPHAERMALEAAGDGARGAALYVTLEPCAMCAGAIVLARVPRVVYGTEDPKAGAVHSVAALLDHPKLNHRPEHAGGLLQEECAELLLAFFRSRR